MDPCLNPTVTTPDAVATGAQEYTLTDVALTYDLSPSFAVDNALCFASIQVSANNAAIPVTIAEVDNLGVKT